jgi:hypothetical protein
MNTNEKSFKTFVNLKNLFKIIDDALDKKARVFVSEKFISLYFFLKGYIVSQIA